MVIHSALARRVLVTLLAVLVPVGRGYCFSRESASAVPTGAPAAVFIEPAQKPGERRSGVMLAAALVDHARRMGLLSGLDIEASLWLDAFAATPVLFDQPLTIVLTRIEARRDDFGGHRLAYMRLGLDLQTDGANARIAATIQRLLNTYTNTKVSRIDAVTSGDVRFHRLIDKRLPEWAVIEWGKIDGHYLITIGRGAFEELAGALRDDGPSLATDEWFQTACGAVTADEDTTRVAWYVDFKALRSMLVPVMDDVPKRVLEGLNLSEVDRGLWFVGKRDRAVVCTSFQRIAESNRVIHIASPAAQDEQGEGIVPSDATTYSLIRWEPREFVSRICDAYLACRSSKAQKSSRAFWQDLQDKLDLSLERDLIHQLGRRIIIHNDPPHPLGIGLLCTVQIEIDGSPRLIREALDKVMHHWRDQTNESVDLFGPERANPSTATAGPRPWILRRATDRIWYVQFGLYGPAITVTDRWIIISSSPQAVRQNVTRLRAGVVSSPRIGE
ncbi:MAG: hypothetical protein IID39_07480 [Planctomycetes bacterium]|nr:hypothetical protein [Planctomycetota bacterium]